jgi:hypothetical protein
MFAFQLYCQQTKNRASRSEKIIRLFGPFAPHKSKTNELSVGAAARSRGTTINQ